MIHKKRIYQLLDCEFDVAAMLIHGQTFTGCAGFRVLHNGETYLVLNDSFGEDGGQEYVVLKVLRRDGDFYHVAGKDSITASWTDTPNDLLRLFCRAAAATGDFGLFTVHAQSPQEHDCGLCA